MSNVLKLKVDDNVAKLSREEQEGASDTEESEDTNGEGEKSEDDAKSDENADSEDDAKSDENADSEDDAKSDENAEDDAKSDENAGSEDDAKSDEGSEDEADRDQEAEESEDEADQGSEESEDDDSDEDAIFEEVVVKVEAVGDGTLVSQTIELSDDEVVIKATPIKGDGIIDAFNTLIVNSFDDGLPVLKLNEIQGAKTNRSRDRLTTVEDGGDYHCLMFSEDVSEVDVEPLQHLVDFIKEYAPVYGMMHNDLHLGNVVYNRESDTLIMIGLSKMSFFKNIESMADINEQVEDTLLQHENYIDNRSFDMNAVRGFQFVDTDEDSEKPVVFNRYLPDLMTLGMYMYTKTIRHHPEMEIPIFKKSKSGYLIGKSDIRLSDVDIDEFWSPILEGIIAYAFYTQDMNETRRKYFNIYTPLGTMDAKIRMEQFLNDYDNVLDTDNFIQNVNVHYSDIYSMLFPASLEEALSKKWRTIRTKEHCADSLMMRGGRNYQYVSHSMLLVTSFVCAIIGSMSW